MKSNEIKTEEDINLHLAKLELQKLKKTSRADRWIFVIGIVKLAALGIFLLLVAIYPDLRESVAEPVVAAAQSVIIWYLLLALVVFEIFQRIVRYRFK